MTGARLFVVRKVGMEPTEMAAHRSGLLDGNVVVGIAVKDVDSKFVEIVLEEQSVTGIGGTGHDRGD